MELDLSQFRGSRLDAALQELSKYDYLLVEVSPPRKFQGEGEKRILDIREYERSSESELSSSEYDIKVYYSYVRYH
ncbi:MAG: hypothetical protein ACQEQG_06055 [Bacillota bacterium]